METGSPAHSKRAAHISALVVTVAVLGALNSFSSRIRAAAFGPSNYAVTILNAAVQCTIWCAAYALFTARGWLPRGQLWAIFRCDGWRWSELGVGKYLLVAAVCDIADNVTGFTAEPMLTTLTYALMNQATVPFSVVFAIALLGTRYTAVELVAVLWVMGVDITCALLGERDTTEQGSDSAGWAVFAALTTSFAALAFTLKERAFREHKPSSPGLSDKALLLNEAPSTASDAASSSPKAEPSAEPESELGFVTASVVVNVVSLLTCVPIVLLNRALVNSDLGDKQPPLGEAISCLWTCDNAAAAFATYASANLLWNGALLLLTAQHSALLTFLALKLQVPLIALLSLIDWPLLGSHPASQVQWLALAAIILGVAAFQWANLRKVRPPSFLPMVDRPSASSALDATLDALPHTICPLTFGGGTHSLKQGPPPAPEQVRIYDARLRAEAFDLQRHSFELVGAPVYDPSSLDVYDATAVTTRLYPLMEQLVLQRLPGAKRVLIFDHLLRNNTRHGAESKASGAADGGVPATPFLERTLAAVHGDYTARSGHTRARQLLEPYCQEAEVEAALSARFSLVNIWHPFGPQPVAADPLGLCVWGTFSPRDVMTKRLVFPHRVGETYQAVHSPAQRWVYFSSVCRQEAILIKTFDSVTDGSVARFSIHSAFRLPEQDGPNAAALPIRESIELRCLVLYGEGTEGLAPGFSNVSLPHPDAPPKVHEQAKLTELEIYNLISSTTLPPGEEW